MGCCNTMNPKSQDIEKASNVFELLTVIKKLQDAYQDEIDEINQHLQNGSPITIDSLKEFDDAALTKRQTYLGNLIESLQECISAVQNTRRELDLRTLKDKFQDLYGCYYVCYDDTKEYIAFKDNIINFAK